MGGEQQIWGRAGAHSLGRKLSVLVLEIGAGRAEIRGLFAHYGDGTSGSGDYLSLNDL